MTTLLTYDTVTLQSSEVISFTYNRDFKINNASTVGDKEITQPGNLSPTIIKVEAQIRDNASVKFTSWIQKLSDKPLFDLLFLTRNFGKYYLSSLDISSDEFGDDGNILRFDMSLTFINNQNF